MQTIYIKWALAGAIILAMFGAGYHYGELNSAKVYIPQLEQLKAAIDASNQAAKLIVQNQEEIYHASKIKLEDSAALINLYRERMLHTASQISTSTPADRPCGANLSSAADSTRADELAFEAGCFELAIWHEACREMVVGNKFPVK